jgi:type II secretory pathway pseudopilin PulG
LIVVAIIAILAAIAVPNFLEAQVRSKVSRCKGDLRSIAVAIEAYRADSTGYPLDDVWYTYPQYFGRPAGDKRPVPDLVLWVTTTPVAYITSIPENSFM